MLNTNARGFTKEQAAKELTDNAVQSTILLFHARHRAALRAALEDAARVACDALDASGRATEFVLGHDELLSGWVHELLSLGSRLDFVRAVGARDLVAACGAPGFALSKPPCNLRAEALVGAGAHALSAFWAAADALATCVRDRAEPGRVDYPRVLLRYDLGERTLECVDNGRGIAPADMRVIMELANSAHGRDATIGHGGVNFESHGSLCSGQFSSYGVGALSAAASLCRPDDGKLERGRFVARSRAAGSATTAQLSMDFAEVFKDQDWTTHAQPSLADAELSPLQRESTARADWGDRFTSVRVCGVDEAYCAKLGDVGARQRLVAYFEDAYYPILNDGICAIACTRPLQRVELTIEFVLPAAAAAERFVLGGRAQVDADGARADGDADRPRYRPRYGTQPTIAEILARNLKNTARELRLAQTAAPAASASALAKLLGEHLSLRCLVTLPRTSPGDAKALAIFFYFPLVGGVETMGTAAEEQLPNGMFTVQNGCRLADQVPLIWNPMRPPLKTKKSASSLNSRNMLTEAAYTRVCGLLLLPPHCALVQNKARLTSEAELELRDEFNWNQVPEFLPEDTVAQPAPAEMTTRGRAAAAPATGGASQTIAQACKELTLLNIYQLHFLKSSRERDEDVLVVDSEAAVEKLVGSRDDHMLFALTFMRKPLDARKPGGLWIRYTPAKAARKVFGRVKHFISRDGFPDPSKSAREGYEAVVERRSADEADHNEETVSLLQISGPEDVDLGEQGLSAYQVEERSRLRLPLRLELMLGANESPVEGATLEQLPEWFAVGGSKIDNRYARYNGKLPLELVLWNEAGERLFSRDNSERAYAPYSEANSSRGGGGLHYLKLDDKRLLAPGTYVLSASVLQSALVTGTHNLRWLGEWCPASLLATDFRATFTIVAEPEQVHLVWQRPAAGAALTSVLRMGCGELPPLHLLVTDRHGRVVSPTGVFTTVSAYMKVALDGELPDKQWLPLEHVERERPPVTEADLDLDRCPQLQVRAMPPEHRLRPYVLRLKADAQCFTLPLDQARKPRRCVVKLCAKLTVVLRSVPTELELQDSREFELVAGRPHELQTPPLPLLLRPGAQTERVACKLVDRWGNTCVYDDKGKPLLVRCADGRGLAWADTAAELAVADDRRHWGQLLIPPMEVSADPGGEASLELALETYEPPAVRARLRWLLEERRLAFHVDGAPPPTADARGLVTTTLTAPEGTHLESVLLRVHLPPSQGGADAAVGAPDDGLGGVEVDLDDSATERGGGGSSGKRKARKLVLIKGEAELSFLVVPRADAPPRTLTARCRGLTAVLVITGEQSPPVRWRLNAAALSARANEQIELTLALVNARDEAVRQHVDLTGVTVRALRADAAGSSAAAAASATGAAADGGGGDDGGDGACEPKIIRPWATARGSATMSASCKLALARVGAHTLEVTGHEGLVPGLADARTSPRTVTITVTAGPPAALRVERVHADEAGAVAHRKFFALRATVVDSAGNPCDAAAELRGAEWRLDLENDADFEFGKKPARTAKGGKQSHDWDGLQLRAHAAVELPLDARLVAHWQPAGSGRRALSAPITVRVEPSGAPQALCVEDARYTTAASTREPTTVRARLRLDDGRYKVPVSSRHVWVLAPAVRARGQFHKVYGQCQPGDEESCFLSFEVHAPDEPGEYELRVCCEAELDDAVAKLVVTEAADAESDPSTEDVGPVSTPPPQPVDDALDEAVPLVEARIVSQPPLLQPTGDALGAAMPLVVARIAPEPSQPHSQPPPDGDSNARARESDGNESDGLEELTQDIVPGGYAVRPSAPRALAPIAPSPAPTMPALATPVPSAHLRDTMVSALRAEHERLQVRRKAADDALMAAKQALEDATRAQAEAKALEGRMGADLNALCERRMLTPSARAFLASSGCVALIESAAACAEDAQGSRGDGAGGSGSDAGDDPHAARGPKRLRLTQL